MSKQKTTLTPEVIKAFLRDHGMNEVDALQQMVEGEESQAFSFIFEGEEFVMRINSSIDGFLKDAYAYAHFHSEQIPIPRVIQTGYIDEQHAFCISAKMPGITLQDTDSATLKNLLAPTAEAWQALSKTNIDHTTGFGDFDESGRGVYATWHEFLLEPQTYEWERVLLAKDLLACNEVLNTFIALVKRCPEERALVHGDFGSNNVLTDGQRITSILDWENAKYGDPLFDVATAYFWSPWLECMREQAVYFEAHLSSLPSYQERILCYQLRIGLAEVYDTALLHRWDTMQWTLKRSVEVARALH
jgi:hygromycin-B 4-O-kinase